MFYLSIYLLVGLALEFWFCRNAKPVPVPAGSRVPQGFADLLGLAAVIVLWPLILVAALVLAIRAVRK